MGKECRERERKTETKSGSCQQQIRECRRCPQHAGCARCPPGAGRTRGAGAVLGQEVWEPGQGHGGDREAGWAGSGVSRVGCRWLREEHGMKQQAGRQGHREVGQT